uniref:Glucose/Sorbosone dehydrogenase domain-containing protein n=1 Tax=Rhodosorus marinus TaxID=101924 RepID=A0A7S3A212_9RHOD|mmetsp:Transcript_41909/g.164258  ORF Transcript_41909/g.164258 Transcript_41909/m.164258 type:complete len:1209 (+) Transcript_41909:390-4016(+)|eukprot:CAMPEP_0113969008 /NCGR_PEP_ID=MMETSP0011_2-20120614/9946_1 /TAXON_ID=101924 /ORGANISM="Rhodosorus marinus" /LENGTH=1208 /DNA_ID=CAMNT_0000982353 /DNA_START=236 /DNA_END=3862 /DNA_ORIENTATION=+ /assembly_acc=CAM_ASM_000156
MMRGEVFTCRHGGSALLLLLSVCTLISGQGIGQLSINFQSSSTSSCSAEVLADYGLPYAEKTNGFTYGWLQASTLEPVDATANGRDRGEESDDSCLFRTFVHMQYGDCCSDEPSEGLLQDIVWRIALPNGWYNVDVLCGEPTSLNSVHAITANGVAIIEPTEPTALVPQVEGSGLVLVSNEVLTLSATGGSNTLLSHVLISTSSVTQAGCVPFPSAFGGQSISELDCTQVRVPVPYEVSYGGADQGMLKDRSGMGTGFTMAFPSSKQSPAYSSENLIVTDNALVIKSTPGRMNAPHFDHTNALGVGLPLPDNDLNITAQFRFPDIESSKWERACVYFGINDQTHIRLCYISTGDGGRVFLHYVQDGERILRTYRCATLTDPERIITFRMELYSLVDEARFFYQVGADAEEVSFRNITLGAEMFSKDAAGIDFTVGTRSYAGVFVSQAFRKYGQLAFELLSFGVTQIPRENEGEGEDELEFDTWYLEGLRNPTSVRYGPDGKLYVAMVDGRIAVIELDHDAKEELSRRILQPLGDCLLLGLEFDPDSNADNVVLWVTHSDASQIGGAANSGKISKVSGPDMEVVEDVIVGLPRASANHAPNQIKFGPDGRLFIAVGGNTGGGTPNDQNSDFGFRPEQCLAAALLVADVKAEGFNGDCTPKQDPAEMDLTGVAWECEEDIDCDVEVYATGTRNPYDFEFYDGHIYMTDNGLGGKGTAPKLPDDYTFGDSCHGPILGDEIVSLDPGRRDDLLIDVVEGAYYGHPNPARRECVFFGGNPTSDQDYPIPRSPVQGGDQYNMQFGKYRRGTQPDPRFTLPMMSLGRSRSANGIIVYRSDVFCGKLRGDILTTFYSQEDQVRRVVLNEDGTEAVRDETLPYTTEATGAELELRNPLCIEQDGYGNLYIGEFFGARVRVLDPVASQCSQSLSSSNRKAQTPQGLEHSAAIGINTRVLALGGARGGIATDEAHAFDSYRNEWTSYRLPIRRFGSGAVRMGKHEVAILGGIDESGSIVDSFHVLGMEDMKLRGSDYRLPAARAHSSVVDLADEFLLVGGIDRGGEATRTVFQFNKRTGTWRQASPLTIGRYGASAIAIGKEILVCGGVSDRGEETRTCEIFDGASWRMAREMNHPRAFAGAVSVSGRAVIKGGQSGESRIYDTVEEYNLKENTWKELKPLNTARSAAAVVRAGSSTILIGGRTNEEVAQEFGEILHYM